MEMTTVTIGIGNSDNRLSQAEWASYVKEVRSCVKAFAHKVHFDGGTNWDSPRQSACFVAEVPPRSSEPLAQSLQDIRRTYLQDSVAVTFGTTELV